MGQLVATNIVGTLTAVEEGGDKNPNLSEIPIMPAMMALAIGKEAVAYQPPQGTFWGEELMQSQFGTDMGLTGKPSSNVIVGLVSAGLIWFGISLLGLFGASFGGLELHLLFVLCHKFSLGALRDIPPNNSR